VSEHSAFRSVYVLKLRAEQRPVNAATAMWVQWREIASFRGRSGALAISPCCLDYLRMLLIDDYLPRYHFSERHRIRVRASPDEVMEIVANFKRPPDRFNNILMALRSLPGRLLGRTATLAGKLVFTPLADNEGETVAGLIGRFWRLDGGIVPIADADAFARFAEAGTPKLVIGYRVAASPGGTLLTTETRVFCPDRHSLLRFLPYWLLIRIPSGLIRRRTLRAIKAAVEKGAGVRLEPRSQ
jgi:hypothetical protein